MKFDPSKPVQCRNGCAAEILATDLSGSWSILAKITHKNGIIAALIFRPHGGLSDGREDEFDLINVPEKVTMYIAKHQYWEGHRLVYTRPSTLDDFDTFYPVEIEVGRKE